MTIGKLLEVSAKNRPFAAFDGNIRRFRVQAVPDFSRLLHGYSRPEREVLHGSRTIAPQIAAQQDLLGMQLVNLFVLWQPLVYPDKYHVATFARLAARFGTVADQAFNDRWTEDAPESLHPCLYSLVEFWPDFHGQITLAPGAGAESFHHQAVQRIYIFCGHAEPRHAPHKSCEAASLKGRYIYGEIIGRQKVQRLPHA